MAERTVSTLIKLDGEQQYRAAIQNINRELTALKAGLQSTQATFAGQRNSMAALTEKSTLLAAQQGVLARKVAETRQMYDAARAAVEQYKAQIATLEERIQRDGDAEGKLSKQLANARESYQKAQNSVVKYSTDVTRAETALTKCNNEIKENAKYLEEARASSTGAATSIDEFGKKTKVAGESAAKMGEAGKQAFDQLYTALVSAGLIKAAGDLVKLFVQAAQAAIEFETAMTGVYKTVEGTPEQLAAISDEITRMSTEIPITTTELPKIAETAGQLGIATNDVSKFTEVMAALGVSTNLTSEDAATMIARFSRITGLPSNEYEKLGSALVALGNDSATTEAEIMDMATGLASAGTQIGLTEAQTLGVAAALSSVGLEAQAGGTAFSRLMIDIATAVETGSGDLAKFAEVAGMTSEQFSSLFNTSAIDALNAFFDGIGNGSESAISMLSDLGITEVRLRDMVLRLASAQGILKSSVDTSTQAFAENTALAVESGKFYATTASQMQILKNSVNALGVTIGSQFTPALREALGAGADATNAINEFLQEHPAAIQAIAGFAAALTTAVVAIAGTALVVKAIIPLISAFTLATSTAAGPIGWIVVAVTALTAAIAAAALAAGDAESAIKDQISANDELVSSIEQTKAAYDDQVDTISSESSAVEGLIKQLDSLTGSQDKNIANSAQIKNVVDQLNSSVDGLGLTYNSTTGEINMTTDAIRQQAEAMFQAKLAAAYVDRQVAVYVELQDVTRELTDTQTALANATANETRLRQLAADTAWENVTLAAQYSKEADDEARKVRSLKKSEQELIDTQTDLTDQYTQLGEAAAGANTALTGSGDVTIGTSKSISDAAKKASETWDTYYDSAKKAADETAGLFNELDGSAKKTVGNLIEIEAGQSSFWETYAANIQKAKEMGLNTDLLAALADGSQQGAQTLQSVVNGSIEDVQALNDAYEQSQQARADYAAQEATLKTELSGTVDDLTKSITDFIANANLSDDAYASAFSTMSGLLTGLEDQYPNLISVINDILSELGLLGGAGVIVLPNGRKLYPLSQRGTTESPTGTVKPTSHATGLPNVPYDNYPALLHKGERVLTAAESIRYNPMSTADMVGNGRSGVAREIAAALGSVAVSARGGSTFHQTLQFTQSDPSPSEIAREAARAQRRLMKRAKG